MSDHLSVRSTANSIGGSFEDIPNNGLMIRGFSEGLEHIFDYEAGGHHPVHLGDMLNHRYKVVHKLGRGGYANVWLCRDVESEKSRYVAVKVIIAEASIKDCPELRVYKLKELGLDKGASARLFSLPVDKFDIEGPNGIHYALVYPVLGPRVSRLPHITRSDDPGRALREICKQATQAMVSLHSHGICHGDFRPGNILAPILGLDGLTEDRVSEVLRKPVTAKVYKIPEDTYDEDTPHDEPTLHDIGAPYIVDTPYFELIPHHEPTAPQYLVYPVDWDKVELSDLGPDFVANGACVIDFGESYDIKSPPKSLGIPQKYAPPEYVFDKSVGIGSDIWALGCTLFEIRTGRHLFGTFDDDFGDYFWKLAMMLGVLPEPWWSSAWKYRPAVFEDQPDIEGRAVKKPPKNPDRSTGYQRPDDRCFEDSLSRGLWCESREGPQGFHAEISKEEIDLFSDLLRKIHKFKPEERISAEEVLDHAWFKM